MNQDYWNRQLIKYLRIDKEGYLNYEAIKEDFKKNQVKMLSVKNIIIAIKILIARICNRMDPAKDQITKLEIRLEYFAIKQQKRTREKNVK